MLCDTAGPSQIEEFLRRASRPKMGKAKAKQSAGQRAIDLTKHLSKFEDMSYEQLLQTVPFSSRPTSDKKTHRLHLPNPALAYENRDTLVLNFGQI